MIMALPVWMTKTDASIDPNPMAHISDLDMPDVVFPLPSALQSNVDFWRKVFAHWHLNQVVFHDADYPELVYEVVDLGGDAEILYNGR